MLRLLVALAVTIALGLASRRYPAGWFLWDRVLGEILYAVAAYLAWAVILDRRPPQVIAALAFGSCLAVELFKLTGVPAGNQDVPFVRWFLGMTFAAVNLAYYAAGAALAALADHAARAARGRAAPPITRVARGRRPDTEPAEARGGGSL